MEDCIPAYGMYGNGDYSDSSVYSFSYSDTGSYGNGINATENLSFLIKQTSQFVNGGGNSSSLFHNESSTLPENNNDTTYHGTHRSDGFSIQDVEDILYRRVVVFICVCGVLGNLLNLVVLTRKGLQRTMDRMEKSAHVGLVALAVSDLLFCLTVIPHAWVDKTGFMFESKNFDLYYTQHGDAIVNSFITSSTWLTVAMATSRYLAVVHPLRARDIIGMTFAKASIIVVFVVSVLFNLPRFWHQKVESLECVGGFHIYMLVPGALQEHKRAETAYYWLYFLLGILIPLILLAFCNAMLIKALRESMRMRQLHSSTSTRPTSDSRQNITLTFIIIIIMYFILLLPAELINFAKVQIVEKSEMTDNFNLGAAIVNTLQAINFSTNFILYCVVNKYFRKTIAELFCCYCIRKNRPDKQYQSVSSTTVPNSFSRTTALTEI